MKHGISVILLAYMEEENLRKVLPQVKKNLERSGEVFEVIVVDTQVPLDNTADVCRENGVIYVNQRNAGFGDAFRTGIEKVSMDRVITIDSDGAHNPNYIPHMIQEFRSGKYDIVIGSRYVLGGGTHDSSINTMMSHLLNKSYGIVFGLKVKDLSTNFRMYYTSDLKNVNLSCGNYDVLQEVLIRIKWEKNRKLQIHEFPIILEERISGNSKRELFKFIISYIRTLIKMKYIDSRQKLISRSSKNGNEV